MLVMPSPPEGADAAAAGETQPTATPLFLSAQRAAVSTSAPSHPFDPRMFPHETTCCMLAYGTTLPAAMDTRYVSAVQNAQAQQLPQLPWFTMGYGPPATPARLTRPGHLSAHSQLAGMVEAAGAAAERD